MFYFFNYRGLICFADGFDVDVEVNSLVHCRIVLKLLLEIIGLKLLVNELNKTLLQRWIQFFDYKLTLFFAEVG